MYSLDVNFLKDRPELMGADKPRGGAKAAPTMGSMVPLFVGLAVGLIPLAAVGGLYFFGQQQNAKLQEDIATADTKINELNGRLQKIKQIEDETNRVTTETKALASVFNSIKPWSAMLQDLRDRIPPGVQINTILQTETTPTPGSVPTPSPSPGNAQNQPAPQLPTAKLEIAGTARTFDEVNDFLLTLQRSSFFKKDETKLVSATLIDNPTQLELPKNRAQSAAQVKIELPKVVDYRIQTSLTDVPASELLRELDRKGAVGLVTRIRTLQQKGVNQQ